MENFIERVKCIEDRDLLSFNRTKPTSLTRNRKTRRSQSNNPTTNLLPRISKQYASEQVGFFLAPSAKTDTHTNSYRTTATAADVATALHCTVSVVAKYFV